MEFRWNAWNLDHATQHSCSVEEIEAVVRNAGRGYPRKQGQGKYLVVARGTGGRFVQAIYVLDADGTRYVSHAMPLGKSGR